MSAVEWNYRRVLDLAEIPQASNATSSGFARSVQQREHITTAVKTLSTSIAVGDIEVTGAEKIFERTSRSPKSSWGDPFKYDPVSPEDRDCSTGDLFIDFLSHKFGYAVVNDIVFTCFDPRRDDEVVQAVREHARHVAIQTTNSGLFAARNDIKADLQISKLFAEQEIELRNTFGLAPTPVQETQSRDIVETGLPNVLRNDFIYKGSVHAERKRRGRGSSSFLRAVYIEDDKAGTRGKHVLIDRLPSQVSQCCSGQLPPHMYQRWMSMKRLWESVAMKTHSAFDKQGGVHRDTINHGLSLVTLSIERLSCMSIASIVLFTSVEGERGMSTLPITIVHLNSDNMEHNHDRY
ncbi:hypothetical protein M436DRAFT_78366 [Aureobasidium namibiae CBS 147.97]|uniref:Uncharacterized protein n=1 Tax=Aureobasidium namibiae CBS 147.97 TaxID=1043004 RepID=A0A074WU21_9PEZI|nr:uncharacterized protein M436DRAFT_78366 [Aureobasidium namibiae CBS 147.97]KEQ76613.1 hypothetical protein M436DRAFT_78366 [Aureobasidium namibiae CBS 147.97]